MNLKFLLFNLYIKMKGEKFPFSETAWPHGPHFFNIEKKYFHFWPFSIWSGPNQRSFGFLGGGLVWCLSLSPPYFSQWCPCFVSKLFSVTFGLRELELGLVDQRIKDDISWSLHFQAGSGRNIAFPISRSEASLVIDQI